MTVTIELPEDSAGLLRKQAEARGLSLEAWIAQLARDRAVELQSQSGRPAKNLVELFAPLRGMDLDFERNSSQSRPVDL
jgi:hypothetical protein